MHLISPDHTICLCNQLDGDSFGTLNRVPRPDRNGEQKCFPSRLVVLVSDRRVHDVFVNICPPNPQERLWWTFGPLTSPQRSIRREACPFHVSMGHVGNSPQHLVVVNKCTARPVQLHLETNVPWSRVLLDFSAFLSRDNRDNPTCRVKPSNPSDGAIVFDFLPNDLSRKGSPGGSSAFHFQTFVSRMSYRPRNNSICWWSCTLTALPFASLPRLVPTQVGPTDTRRTDDLVSSSFSRICLSWSLKSRTTHVTSSVALHVSRNSPTCSMAS